ncbi:MAG: MFS transporter [endosymbiont of Galathealinum brachiosum]|uniref:MFS transporter n=1 Tax=endosymbiont of Galathealinum brachiosum TaxID=2200906 RepID=A0A370DJV9_9GAMM|nr:MAG: MFS transporter [endosymbiont of Galathealinum brachiosum]
MTSSQMPYWRLSGFYWVYFASLGVVVPYWSLYLNSLGFDARSIGELMAILMATKIVAPYLWSWIADHTGHCMKIIRVASICSTIAFLGVFLDSSFWWLVIVMLLFSFFWNATLPQFEANTMNHLGEHTHKYSVVRLWGSMGFVVSVIVIGVLLDEFGYQLVPVSVFILYVLIVVFSFLVKDAPCTSTHIEQGSILKVLKQPHVMALLLICFLMQMSHGPYYTFYSIYLKQFGYSSSALGWLWALGVIAEIILFMFMHKLMPKYRPRSLMIIALALTTLRWLLIGAYVEDFLIVIFAQCLHAASFGLYHAVAIELFHRNFKGKLQGRGQALYSAISFGAGGAVGTLLSGAYWDAYSPQVIFSAAAMASLLALFVVVKMNRLERVI